MEKVWLDLTRFTKEQIKAGSHPVVWLTVCCNIQHSLTGCHGNIRTTPLLCMLPSTSLLSNLPFPSLLLLNPLSSFINSSRIQRNAPQRFCFQGESSSAHPRSRPHVRSFLRSTLKLKKRRFTNSTRQTKACSQQIYLVCTIKQTLHTVATNPHPKSATAQS